MENITKETFKGAEPRYSEIGNERGKQSSGADSLFQIKRERKLRKQRKKAP